jgi:hypothetical protein
MSNQKPPIDYVALQQDIDDFMDMTTTKIFDVVTVDNIKYYVDTETSLIWDNENEVVGIVDKNKKLVFFNTIDNLINDIVVK